MKSTIVLMALATANADPFSARRLANTTNATGTTGIMGPTKTCPKDGEYVDGIEKNGERNPPAWYDDGSTQELVACCTSCAENVPPLSCLASKEERISDDGGSDTLEKRISDEGCFNECFFKQNDKTRQNYLLQTTCSGGKKCCDAAEAAVALDHSLTTTAKFDRENKANTATVGLASIAILAVVAALTFMHPFRWAYQKYT